MQLPKNVRKHKQHEKYCMYPGCGKLFFGISITKYCYEHRKEEYRIRNRYKDILGDANQEIDHDKIKATPMTVTCACCGSEFTFKLFSKVRVYPKYCEEHRNEYRRKIYKDGLRIESD